MLLSPHRWKGHGLCAFHCSPLHLAVYQGRTLMSNNPKDGGCVAVVADMHSGPHTPAPTPRLPCSTPQHGYCSRVHATPTHEASGVLASGQWPAGASTMAAAQPAVAKLCDSNSSCATFGLGSDARAGRSYQLYRHSPAVLDPLSTPDWTLFYKNASCCEPPPPAPPVVPERVFGPGSCPALRYDKASGYWHMLYTPNPTVGGGDYRTWQIYAARSKTLATGSWELSPMNPVMEADAFDRQIHNGKSSLTIIPTS